MEVAIPIRLVQMHLWPVITDLKISFETLEVQHTATILNPANTSASEQLCRIVLLLAEWRRGQHREQFEKIHFVGRLQYNQKCPIRSHRK